MSATGATSWFYHNMLSRCSCTPPCRLVQYLAEVSECCWYHRRLNQSSSFSGCNSRHQAATLASAAAKPGMEFHTKSLHEPSAGQARGQALAAPIGQRPGSCAHGCTGGSHTLGRSCGAPHRPQKGHSRARLNGGAACSPATTAIILLLALSSRCCPRCRWQRPAAPPALRRRWSAQTCETHSGSWWRWAATSLCPHATHVLSAYPVMNWH